MLWMNWEIDSIGLLLLLDVHGLLIFDISDVLVEMSIVAGAVEGVVDGDGMDEVELLDLE